MEQLVKVLFTVMGASLVWAHAMQALTRRRRTAPRPLVAAQETRARFLPHLFGGLAASPLRMQHLRFVAFYGILSLVLFCVAVMFALASLPLA